MPDARRPGVEDRGAAGGDGRHGVTDVFCCIIGAGPRGLAAGADLRRAAVEFVILEQARGVGGIWDFSRSDTPIYASTHFISSAGVSGFDEFPMPRDYPDYPRHDLVLPYVSDYADHAGLRPFLRFGVRVDRAVRTDEQWRLETSDGAVRCEALISAVGHNWRPGVPHRGAPGRGGPGSPSLSPPP